MIFINLKFYWFRTFVLNYMNKINLGSYIHTIFKVTKDKKT